MKANCCGPPRIRRRYLSRQEKAEILERYADQLRGELTAVEERIEELTDA